MSIDAMPTVVSSKAETTTTEIKGDYRYSSNWSAKLGAAFDRPFDGGDEALVIGIGARYGIAGGPNTEYSTRSTSTLIGEGEVGIAFNPRDSIRLELVGIAGFGIGLVSFKTAAAAETVSGPISEAGACVRPLIELDYGYRLFAEVGYVLTSLTYNSAGYKLTDQTQGMFGGAGLAVIF